MILQSNNFIIIQISTILANYRDILNLAKQKIKERKRHKGIDSSNSTHKSKEQAETTDKDDKKDEDGLIKKKIFNKHSSLQAYEIRDRRMYFLFKFKSRDEYINDKLYMNNDNGKIVDEERRKRELDDIKRKRFEEEKELYRIPKHLDVNLNY